MKTTPYSEYVDMAINTVLEKQRKFTLGELSQQTGMKITNSFRRRVDQWVKNGRLERTLVHGKYRGSWYEYEDMIPF
jgi:response regulator of citrate/malate metabolism